VRNIAAEHRVALIDLAREMPKRTEYYYDTYHFTNAGCQKVAEIVYQDLYPLLENMQFPTGKSKTNSDWGQRTSRPR
jgi:lysophospholipase L1-like esterase